MKYLIVILFLLFTCKADLLQSDKYDEQIRHSVAIYWNDFPIWQWYKAQLYQESLLNTNAKSPAGAKGLAQFMPRTWLDMQRQMNMPSWVTPYMPSYAIEAGAYYMRRLRNNWSWNRPMLEKHYLALASYNAGLGNILKAQLKCKKLDFDYVLWEEIKMCLPYVTGKHSQETIIYIERIKKWEKRLK